MLPLHDLAAASGEGEFAQRVDEIRVLRNRNELIRRDPSPVPVWPTHQRLDPPDAAVREHNLRLKVDLQFPSRQSEAQLVLQLHAGRPLGGHGRRLSAEPLPYAGSRRYIVG